MFGSGLSKRPARRPRTTCGVSRRSRRAPLLATIALGLGSLAVTPPAAAATFNSVALDDGQTYYVNVGLR